MDGFFLVVRSSEVEDDVDERAVVVVGEGGVGGALVSVADARYQPLKDN